MWNMGLFPIKSNSGQRKGDKEREREGYEPSCHNGILDWDADDRIGHKRPIKSSTTTIIRMTPRTPIPPLPKP